MLPLEQKIEACARTYEELTGFKLSYRGVCNPRLSFWAEWLKLGFGPEDLRIVIGWLQGRIRAGVRRPECLKFSNLIADPYRFEEELEVAKAERRNAKPKRTERENVIALARPVVTEDKSGDNTQSVAQLIEKLRKAAS